MSQAMAVLTSQSTHEWYTPAVALSWVRAILGHIDLDPASCAAANEHVRARRFFTAEDDGLGRPWDALTVFLNPPFDATPTWVSKMADEYAAGRFVEGVLLVNSAPGYRWYERLWRERPVCCLAERLRFVRHDGAAVGQAKKGQTLAYFGPSSALFSIVLRDKGRFLLPDREVTP
jgi:ParB family chromosome partitioning protein